MVELLWQICETGLAYTEVAAVVIVYAVVADCSADAAEIADVIDVGDFLEIEGVADRAAFFRTGRCSTPHAVELFALAAV